MKFCPFRPGREVGRFRAYLRERVEARRYHDRAGAHHPARAVPVDHFGAAIQYFTGSKEHNIKLRGLAQEKGLTLNEWGLYKLNEYDKAKKETGQPPAIKAVASKTETDVYRALGLEYIEPELREDRIAAHVIPRDAAASRGVPRGVLGHEVGQGLDVGRVEGRVAPSDDFGVRFCLVHGVSSLFRHRQGAVRVL